MNIDYTLQYLLVENEKIEKVVNKNPIFMFTLVVIFGVFFLLSECELWVISVPSDVAALIQKHLE